MPFIPITADISWQELPVAQQIAIAYNKRRAVLGLSTINPTSNMTVYDFVTTVQAGIEAMYSYFSNPNGIVYGTTSLPTNFPSLALMFYYAGMPVEFGWRRVAEGNSNPADWSNYLAAGWNYGKMQPKDLAGPWLFVDLQNAISLLRQRIIPGTPSELFYKSTGQVTSGDHGIVNQDVTVTGNIVLTNTSDDTRPKIMVYKCKQAGVTYVDYINITISGKVYSAQYTATALAGIGASLGAIYFGYLVSAESTDCFTSVTNVPSSYIGKTMLRAVGPYDADSWTAYGHVFDSHDHMETHTWQEISDALPSSSVPTSGVAERAIICNEETYFVVQYAFND